MFPGDLDNIYVYATERRKEEMRYAAKRRLGREALDDRKPISSPMAVWRVLAFLWTALISR